MKFQPTKYQLMNVGTGRIFDDSFWTLGDPEATAPSLVRAVYENETFTPRDDLRGLYRYAGWLPVNRTLRHSHAPVTYKSKGLADLLGMKNLYITLSGYVPKKGANTITSSPSSRREWSTSFMAQAAPTVMQTASAPIVRPDCADLCAAIAALVDSYPELLM